jgi:HSP20 family protein
MTGLMKQGQGYRTLRSEMDRVFDDFFGLMPARREGSATLWSPSVDISETADNFIVRAELPGMKKEDIELEVENNVLSIRGERKFEKTDEGENYHFMERSYGSFYRSFTLPKNVDSETIGAEYKDGMLVVTIPKKEEVKPKKVEITQ